MTFWEPDPEPPCLQPVGNSDGCCFTQIALVSLHQPLAAALEKKCSTADGHVVKAS